MQIEERALDHIEQSALLLAVVRDTGPVTTSRDRAFWVICSVLIVIAVLIMITN